MIWNYTKPIVIKRRFLKPKRYVIYERILQEELEKIFKKYGF